MKTVVDKLICTALEKCYHHDIYQQNTGSLGGLLAASVQRKYLLARLVEWWAEIQSISVLWRMVDELGDIFSWLYFWWWYWSNGIMVSCEMSPSSSTAWQNITESLLEMLSSSNTYPLLVGPFLNQWYCNNSTKVSIHALCLSSHRKKT